MITFEDSITNSQDSSKRNCCFEHSHTVQYYTLTNVRIVEIRPELYVYPQDLLVSDPQWEDDYYFKAHIIAWDEQFQSYVLDCGSLVDLTDRDYITYEPQSLGQGYHLIEQNEEIRRTRGRDPWDYLNLDLSPDSDVDVKNQWNELLDGERNLEFD